MLINWAIYVQLECGTESKVNIAGIAAHLKWVSVNINGKTEILHSEIKTWYWIIIE